VELKTIEAFGNTIQCDYEDFKESYKNKKSVIKEVATDVYIHTSFNSETMKKYIVKISESIGAKVEFPNINKTWSQEEIQKEINKSMTLPEIK
jgi:hypothetical protein